MSTTKATTRRAPATQSASVHQLPVRLESPDLEYEDDLHDGLVLPSDSMSGVENIADRVQSTQNRLSQLRAEAEALELEKQQFEELSRKQHDFMQGRTDMVEKLNRSVTMLERESYESQKRAEHMIVLRESFQHHLDLVQTLTPEKWNPADLQHDLNRALSMIEDAREEYEKGMSRVQMLTNAAPAPAARTAAQGAVRSAMPVEISRESFLRWAFVGAAFALPMATAAGVLWLIAGLFR